MPDAAAPPARRGRVRPVFLPERSFMSTHYQFYLDRADEARRDAAAATLANVRERCLRAAAAWDVMASRVQRTERMRAETEARKAEAALVPAE